MRFRQEQGSIRKRSEVNMSTQIKIITGLSGAGKSTVIDKLEDMGFYCIDNLPPALLEKFLDLIIDSKAKTTQKVAIVIDIRGRAFFEGLKENLSKLKLKYEDVEVIFLEANRHVLVKRFKETRRTHPLSLEGKNESSMINAIEEEIRCTAFLKEIADKIIDTSSMSKRELNLLLLKIFSIKSVQESTEIIFNSFGFKYGVPLHADMIFDVRFIENPFYIKDLRPLSGEDKPVYDFIFSQEISEEYYQKLFELLDFSFKCYSDEARNQIVVSIGCTGGKHRSVAFTKRLATEFSQKGYNVKMSHRDKDKDKH